MCCHGNIKHFFLLKFCTKVLLIISKNTERLVEKQCHSDVITELEGAILHKHCFKNVLPWEHEQSNSAQI